MTPSHGLVQLATRATPDALSLFCDCAFLETLRLFANTSSSLSVRCCSRLITVQAQNESFRQIPETQSVARESWRFFRMGSGSHEPCASSPYLNAFLCYGCGATASFCKGPCPLPSPLHAMIDGKCTKKTHVGDTALAQGEMTITCLFFFLSLFLLSCPGCNSASPYRAMCTQVR